MTVHPASGSPRPQTPMANSAMTMTELDRVGLLHAEPTARISRFALFVPADHLGVLRPVVVAGGAVICAFATVHGGVALAENALVEEQAVIGKPEHGYAVGRIHPGAGGMTLLGAESVIRSGAIVYADVEVAAATVVGHQSVLRTGVRVGAETVLGHHLCVERGTWIGQRVRCSPGSHITSSTHLADEVFLGAGVRTVNDKTLTWRDPNREPILVPPRFETGAKVGTGSVIMGGVTIGARALVGAGSLVTRDIPPGALAYGHPARVHGKVNR